MTYCDIHNHSLPGVDDDGARDFDSAFRMLRLSVEEGVSEVVLTPHSRAVRKKLESGELLRQVETLRRACAKGEIAITLTLGMEVFLEPNLPELFEQGLALPINGSKYMLVESPYTKALPRYTEDVLLGLQLKGVTPIIAHPERCDAFMAEPGLLAPFVERGMLVQVTAGSITGAFGATAKRTAEYFLKQGLVHVLASDGHGSHGTRKPRMAEGVKAAAKFVGEAQAEAMASTTPRAIVANQPV